LDTEKEQQAKVEKLYGWIRTQSKDTLRGMGARGLDIIEKEYSKDIVTGQYLRLIEGMCR